MAGIPEYGILSLDPTELIPYELRDWRYEPAPVTIDVARPLPHRA